MQDASQPDNRSQAGADTPGAQLPSAGGSLAPALALLRAVFGDLVPNGPLGPDSVPAAVLAQPIALATENLVRHAKKCQDPRCAHIPPPLLPYRRMRPEAIRHAKVQVNRVLWTHPDHELVIWVREKLREKHRELAEEVSTGALLQGDKLERVLSEMGTDGPPSLAAVLWASRFSGPHAEELFRCMVPLITSKAKPREKAAVGGNDQELGLLNAKLRTAVKDLKEARRSAEYAQHNLALKERVIERLRDERQAIEAKHRDAADALALLQERNRDTNEDLQASLHNAEGAARVNSDLRRELRRFQQAQRTLEVDRSDLARQLAAGRRQVEHLKLQLTSVPRGLDAVMEVLRAEEERIQLGRTTMSGGAKARADKEWTAYRKLEKAFFDAHPEYRTPRPVKLRPKVPLRLVALGGSGEVGRSCYLIELGQHRILVDCGIKPSGSEDLHPDIASLDRIDAVILTHAHTDHIGWVPALVNRFGEVAIYCSEGTAALLPVMLADCRQHYIRKLAAKRERAQYIHNAEHVVDEYDDKDVHTVPKLVITCEFDEPETLAFADASIRFFRAGHILGAASVLIEDQSGRRIFFSGDFSSFPQLTVPAAIWPDDLGEVDLLVLESTYGHREHHMPLADCRSDIIAFIRQTIEARNGSVILASFALGRAQELLKMIAIAREDGRLPTSVPVHIDGMIRQINPIYRNLASFDVAPDLFNEISGETERDEVASSAERRPAIIVTTSGMLAGGPVVVYARRLLPDARHRIVLTGYQDEGAPSRALRELTQLDGGSRVVEIADEDGELVRFTAAMPAKEVGLSAHADRRGLIDYASRMRPRVIALVHGEEAAQRELRSRLSLIHPRAEIECGPAELQVP